MRTMTRELRLTPKSARDDIRYFRDDYVKQMQGARALFARTLLAAYRHMRKVLSRNEAKMMAYMVAEGRTNYARPELIRMEPRTMKMVARAKFKYACEPVPSDAVITGDYISYCKEDAMAFAIGVYIAAMRMEVRRVRSSS